MSRLLLAAIFADDTTRWIAIAAAMVTIAYALLRPMRRRKDPLDDNGGVPRLPLAQQRGLEHQMSSLLVELSEMARQITGQLDTRATKLELLIHEADEKIERLRTMTGAGGGANGNGDLAANQEPKSPVKEGAGGHAAEAAEPDPRHVEVYALADRGCSPAEIARQLGRPSGEIELILALRTSAAG